MHPIISIVALIINIMLVVKQIKIWKLRVFLSPGFYFGILWSFGLLGVVILHPVGLLFEKNPQYIDELSVYVGFTALCFWLLTSKGKDKVNLETINMVFPKQVFNFLSFIMMIMAVYEFVRTGASWENMGGARLAVHETQASRSFIVNYGFIVSASLSIISGHELMLRLSKQSIYKGFSIILLFPLFSNLLMSISVGGRVNFTYSMTYYLLGAAFVFDLKGSFAHTLKTYKRQIVIILLSLMIVVGFITYIGNQRSIYSKERTDYAEQYLSEISPVLGVIYGPVNYVIASYDGYQLRRVDAVDPDHLGYGRYTFNGFINWTLPFAGQLGLSNFSIAKLLGIYYFNQETYDYERERYYTTHSCYIPIFKDFGYWGSFLCIIFLTVIAHNLFVKIQSRKKIKYCCSLWFYLLFWDYWVKSNMYGTLSASVMVSLYGLLFVDIIILVFSSYKK